VRTYLCEAGENGERRKKIKKEKRDLICDNVKDVPLFSLEIVLLCGLVENLDFEYARQIGWTPRAEAGFPVLDHTPGSDEFMTNLR